MKSRVLAASRPASRMPAKSSAPWMRMLRASLVSVSAVRAASVLVIGFPLQTDRWRRHKDGKRPAQFKGLQRHIASMAEDFDAIGMGAGQTVRVGRIDI